ncbi:MAG: PorP/SprF family type IX secretion system membrane protein [Crocinitomicaceae bacterium]|nr:PorP/SprF family type IX secretion system membrane protein [Crocinitomicaceae bacterium]
MKRLLIVGLVALISDLSFSQTNTRFSQFNVVKGLMNPAAIGVEAKISAELIYRTQWTAQQGAPQSVGFIGSYEINNSHAVSISAMNDRLGISKSTGVNLGYAYRIYINDEQNFAFGLNMGIQNINNDYSRLFLINQNDPAFMQSFNQWRFNAGFGMFYNGPRMYIGYSIPQLFNNIHTGPNNGLRINMWHHYLSTGFYLANKDASYIFNPCIQLKLVPNSPLQGDLLLRNIFYGRYAFSLGYRTENAIIAGFDIMIANKARIGYHFNYNIGRFSKFMATSHEIYLGLGLPFYYETNRFAKRQYINNKSNFSNDYKQRSGKLNKRSKLRPYN